MTLPICALVRTWGAVALLAVLATACSGSSSEPAADELSYELFPTTKLLSAADLAGLDAAPDGTLTFAVAPASLADVDVGSVILAATSPATPAGLLRVVTDLSRDGARLTLHTFQAPLALAFRKLHVRSERDVTGFGSRPWAGADLSPRTLRPRSELIGGDVEREQPIDFLLYDADNDPSTTNDQIGIRGSLGGGFHYGISVDVDWGDVFDVPQAIKSCIASIINVVGGKLPDCSLAALLPEVRVKFAGDPFMKAHATMYGAASLSYEKKFEVATISLAPIPIGPLVFVPSVDITAGVEGSANAGFTVGAHGGIALTSSVTLSSKHINTPEVAPIAVKSVDFVADETKVILQAKAKVSVGARLNVQLYGIAGPYAQASAFAEVTASAQATPCWALHVGVDASLGVRITSPTIPFLGSVTLLDWKGLDVRPLDQVLASGACLPVDRGPPLPPGSGPDAVSYANPSFTPWARVTTPVGDDSAVNSFLDDGLEWTDATPTIDGRYAVVGSRSDAVVKLDDAGGLVWSRRYRREANSSVFTPPRLVPTHAASLLILTQAKDGERASLLKIGQGGAVWFRRRIELAADAGCDFEPRGLARDAQNGFFVLADCLTDQRAALAHLDENGDVLGVQLFGDTNPQERKIVPSAMAAVGDDVVVMGASSTVLEGSRMFAVRLSPGNNAPKWSNRLVGCPDALDLHPAQARLNANNQLTVVGTGAQHRAGMVMRIKDDGSLAFMNLTRLDPKGDFPYNILAFAELPTTGILVAGSTSDHGQATIQPTSLVLASLDSVGRTLWTKLYTLPGGRAVNHASLRLTDDGGALVTGVAQHTTQPGGGLFAMKAFAKDGELLGAPGVTVSSMSAIAPVDCPVDVVPWAVTVTSVAATTSDAPTLFEDAAVRVQ